MAKVQVKKGQKQASGCHYFMADWDSHHYCPSCRDKGKGDDVCVVEKQEDCYICLQFTLDQVKKLKAKKVLRKIKEGSMPKELEDSLLGVDILPILPLPLVLLLIVQLLCLPPYLRMLYN